MVQRHERWCFTLRFCSLWCEAFAPHTASSRVLIPRCVPLHHRRRDRGQFGHDEESCVVTHHNESSCLTHGEVKNACIAKCLRHSMVQRHERRCFTLRFCSLWCEGFAPHTVSSRSPISRCVPLHHRRKKTAVSWAVARSLALSCIIMHHDESSCMTHGEVKMLVLHTPENAYVIPWCKGTYGGVSR